MHTQCYVCHNFLNESGQYTNQVPDNFNSDNVSHGICPDCFPHELERIERELKEVQ